MGYNSKYTGKEVEERLDKVDDIDELTDQVEGLTNKVENLVNNEIVWIEVQ